MWGGYGTPTGSFDFPGRFGFLWGLVGLVAACLLLDAQAPPVVLRLKEVYKPAGVWHLLVG